MKFLECGDCTACCDGNLIGDAYGIKFGNKLPCSFLISKKCSIYEFRPQACKNYQCAWSQGLFESWMKPTLSNTLVSVEIDQTGKQYLKVVIIDGKRINPEVIDYLDKWVELNNTYYVIVGVSNEAEFRIGVEEVRKLLKRGHGSTNEP